MVGEKKASLRDLRLRCVNKPGSTKNVWCGRDNTRKEVFETLDEAASNQLTVYVIACPDCVAMASLALRGGHRELGYIDPAVLNRERLEYVIRHGVPESDAVLGASIGAVDHKLGYLPQPNIGVLDPKPIEPVLLRKTDTHARYLRVLHLFLMFFLVYLGYGILVGNHPARIVYVVFFMVISCITIWHLSPPKKDEIERLRQARRDSE